MTAQPDKPGLPTVAQVTDELNVKQNVVQDPIKTGELRAFQVGGRGVWRIVRQDVGDSIEQGYRAHTDSDLKETDA